MKEWIELFKSLRKEFNDIKDEADYGNALLLKLKYLRGKIEGMKMALEWTQKEKKWR